MARREPVRGSWFAAVLGLSVLAVAAFVVGAVAGLLWKEPGLLVAYLRGDTTEVAWTLASAEVTPAGPAPAAEAEAPASESPPSGEAAPVAGAKAVPGAPPDAKPAPAPAVAAAPPASIAIQVGAFSERASADRLRSRLREAGFPAYLATDSRDDRHWRVRVGPYATRSEAEKVAGRLERAQQLPTWILDEDAG